VNELTGSKWLYCPKNKGTESTESTRSGKQSHQRIYPLSIERVGGVSAVRAVGLPCAYPVVPCRRSQHRGYSQMSVPSRYEPMVGMCEILCLRSIVGMLMLRYQSTRRHLWETELLMNSLKVVIVFVVIPGSPIGFSKTSQYL
jgi:hypothetical protein